jgi:hypothetical protein
MAAGSGHEHFLAVGGIAVDIPGVSGGRSQQGSQYQQADRADRRHGRELAAKTRPISLAADDSDNPNALMRRASEKRIILCHTGFGVIGK